jgi:HD domain/GAF domain
MVTFRSQHSVAAGDANTSPALQLATIAEVSAKIAGARTCEAILRVLFGEARWLLTFARCALVLPVEHAALRVWSLATAGATPQVAGVPRPGGGPVGRVLAHLQPLAVNDLDADWPGAEGEVALLGKAMRSALILPLSAEDGFLGALVFSARRTRAYPPEVMGIARLLALQVAGALRTALLLEEVDGQETVILSLALAIEAKDPYTEGHCQRLADYAVLLGRDLGMAGRDLDRLRMAALLHDLGKIAVPEAILRKPGPLTVEEYEIIKEHPVIGERICRPLRSARAILPGIRHHHERWDGAGYPDGLCGEAIPLDARIIALVDACDVMVSDRPYRRGMPLARALAILRENAGPQWDPALVGRFLRLIEARATPAPVPSEPLVALDPGGGDALVGGK